MLTSVTLSQTFFPGHLLLPHRYPCQIRWHPGYSHMQRILIRVSVIPKPCVDFIPSPGIPIVSHPDRWFDNVYVWFPIFGCFLKSGYHITSARGIDHFIKSVRIAAAIKLAQSWSPLFVTFTDIVIPISWIHIISAISIFPSGVSIIELPPRRYDWVGSFFLQEYNVRKAVSVRKIRKRFSWLVSLSIGKEKWFYCQETQPQISFIFQPE